MRLVDVHAEPSAKETLFECLQKRQAEHAISHKAIPSFEDHCLFVDSKPYRAWYLIEDDGAYIGSAYLTEMNEIGLFLIPGHTEKTANALSLMLSKNRPLPAIKSKRVDAFSINVNPGNLELIEEITNAGGRHIQNTYIFP